MWAEYGLSHAYMISLWRSGRNGRLTGAGSLCQREIAHQVYCEPLPLFRASTVGLPSRLYIEGQTTWEGSEISSLPSSVHHEPASTSSWIRRCNRQYIFLPQSTLISRCRARDEKFLSKTGLQAPSAIAANSVSSLAEQRLDPSRGGQMIAPILSGKGTNERSFSQRKRLTMNALHSLENRARVLSAQRISRVCHLVSETLTRIGTPPKAFQNTHTSETKSPEEKKRGWCVPQASFYARRCSLACVIGAHLPMSSALGVCNHASRHRSRWRRSHSDT